jgi:hypothetical protein
MAMMLGSVCVWSGVLTVTPSICLPSSSNSLR